ncbi:MAG: enoyl-CoA hydratase [Acidobacteria bacterium]|nr:enoyl-CoA hydratase [Acidobacteriota bacterium]
MKLETLLYEVREGVGKVTLHRPERYNAFNLKMVDELSELLRRLSTDETVKVIILTGAGKAFSAGGDVREMAEALRSDPSDFIRALVGGVHEMLLLLRRIPQPVIASLNGVATGGGFNLMLACDLRIAASTARFNQAFVHIGLSPDTGGTYLLPRLIGLGRATELMLMGEFLDASQALSIGLINRVIPPEELESVTWDLALRLAQGPHVPLRETKALLNASMLADLEAQLEREAQAITRCASTRDFAEGIQAFFEKRAARFSGR